MWDHPVLLGTLIQIRDNHALPIHVVADLYVEIGRSCSLFFILF